MKKLSVFLVFIALAIGCSNDDDTISNPTDKNKVLLLKIDFETNIFEEGKELVFKTNKDFDISTQYVQPGDFGSIALSYKGTEEKVFSGTIIWSGKGAIEYPESFTQPQDFQRIDTPLQMPEVSTFQKVMYGNAAYYPDTIEYQKIWESVDDLALVKEFRTNNPKAKINILLYTPSVGILDTAAADWILIIEN